jgi:hypothetical protein
MTDTSLEPTDWWLDSTESYSQNRATFVPSVTSNPGADISRWITTTTPDESEDYSVTSATPVSEPSNSTPDPLVEQANTSEGLPMISLPPHEKWIAWLKAQHETP